MHVRQSQHAWILWLTGRSQPQQRLPHSTGQFFLLSFWKYAWRRWEMQCITKSGREQDPNNYSDADISHSMHEFSGWQVGAIFCNILIFGFPHPTVLPPIYFWKYAWHRWEIQLIIRRQDPNDCSDADIMLQGALSNPTLHSHLAPHLSKLLWAWLQQ